MTKLYEDGMLEEKVSSSDTLAKAAQLKAAKSFSPKI